MRSQEQAFRVYYSAMTDQDLLRIAANKASFIRLAQTVLADELAKRHLSLPAEEPRAGRAKSGWGAGLTKLAHLWHHAPTH